MMFSKPFYFVTVSRWNPNWFHGLRKVATCSVKTTLPWTYPLGLWVQVNSNYGVSSYKCLIWKNTFVKIIVILKTLVDKKNLGEFLSIFSSVKLGALREQELFIYNCVTSTQQCFARGGCSINILWVNECFDEC